MKKSSIYFALAISCLTLITSCESNESNEEELVSASSTNALNYPATVRLINDYGNRYAEVADNSFRINVYMNDYNYSNGDSQRWKLSLDSTGDWFEIRNEATGKVMAVDGNNIVEEISNPNRDDQKWRFTNSSDCTGSNKTCYKLENKGTGKFAAVVGSTSNGTSIVARSSKNSNQQLWEIAAQ